MSKFLNDFKEFALKGNIVDMAVGVIIGGAFGKIVTSLVNDIIMPVVSLATGGVNFSDKSIELSQAVKDPVTNEIVKEAVTWNYGMFIQNIIDFLIIAICIFVAIRMAMKLKKKEAEPDPAPAAPEPTKEEVLLTQIRDLLEKQANTPASKN
ncbi:MAG: large-conductance mechanosensitive channel protein MscL [Muribaculaceae bacterium]|nr:large-conductance mechanosensitive channel protein MscL [Muribaculaceae bacterium]